MKNYINRIAIAALVMLVLTGLELKAQDGQWRGPNRDGKYPDTGLEKSWPEDGPARSRPALGTAYHLQPDDAGEAR